MIQDLYERKLGFGEILKASWQIYSRNFFYIFLFCFLAGCIMRGLDYLTFISLPHPPKDPALVAQCRNIFSGFFGFIFSIAAISIADSSDRDLPVCWNSIISPVRKFFWAAFLISVLSQVVSSLMWVPGVLVRFNNVGAGASLVLILPLTIISLMLAVYFSFTLQALVLRGRYGVSAFAYSFQAVKGRWWSVFGKIIVLGLMMVVPVVILTLILRKPLHLSVGDGMYFLFPVAMIFGAYKSIFMTIFFLNIDRQNGGLSPEELRHPVDPVNPV